MKRFKFLGGFTEKSDAHDKCRLHAKIIRNMGQSKEFAVRVEQDKDDGLYIVWLYKA